MSLEASEDGSPSKKSSSKLEATFDPVALAAQGTRRGSRYSVIIFSFKYSKFFRSVSFKHGWTDQTFLVFNTSI